MTRRGRRWLRLLATLAIVGVALWLAAPRLTDWLVRVRLQTLIAQQLDARLDIGKLIYHAPYGVMVTDASLVTTGPDGQPLELLRMPRLDLRLAQRPWASGPLLINSVILTSPSLHLVRTTAGIVGRKKPVATDSPAKDSNNNSKTPLKLSRIFRLTQFVLQGGNIEYDDLAHAHALPLVWKNINIDLNTSRVSEAGYAYHLNINNEPIARFETSGVADLDELTLNVEKCALVVRVDPTAHQSALPAEFQEPLKNWQARGVLSIDATGKISLSDPASSTWHSVIELNQASARVPGWQTPVDRLGLKIELTDGSDGKVDGKPFAPGQHPTATIDQMELAAGDSVFRLNHAEAIADAQKRTWRLTGLSGHIDPGISRAALPASIRAQLDRLKIRGAVDFALEADGPLRSRDLGKYAGRLEITPIDFTLQPPGFESPVDGITPLIFHVADGMMTAETLRGTCGDNLVYLKTAELALNDFPNQIKLSNLAGCITFGPSQKYPPLIARQLEPVKPVGPFFFNGSLSLDSGRKSNPLDYNIQVHTTRGRMTVSDRMIPVTNIDTVVNVTPAAATISRFEASVLEGSTSATGRIDLTGRMPYQMNVNLRDIDLAELGQFLADPGKKPMPLSGRAVFKADFNGQVPAGADPAWKGLTGNGEFEVLHGDFWRIPVMKSISDSVAVKQAVTVGEAAGQFHLFDGRIHFDRAVANSPVLGVEGTGDVYLSDRIDMTLIANPLGNWGQHVADGGIAKLLDIAQHGVNIATQQALYQVQLTGKASDPKPNAVPTPFLSKQASRLLGAAGDQSRKIGLLETLHHEANTPGQ